MLYTNHDSFLSELSKLFESGRQKGKSVYITFKRYDGRTTRNPRKPNDKPKKAKKGQPETPVCQGGDLAPAEYKCLIRAKLGDRKISVNIGQKDMNKFQLSYSNLIKGNIYGLKKQQQKVVTSGTTTNLGDKQQNPSATTSSNPSAATKPSKTSRGK